MILSQECTFLISPSQLITIISPNSCPNIQPGDVICLDTVPFNQVLITNLHGEPDNPIILRNFGGQSVISGDSAYYGISVRNSSHLIIIGDGHPDYQYGIAIAKVGKGAGLSLDQYSTDITVSQVEISNTALAGLIAKTDPDCSFNSLRDKFTMYNITVKDCYLHDIGMEGFYIGSTFYNGRVITCDGKDTLVYPHVMEGVKIYRNIIERTGRNGMQVNSAVKDCQIFDNRISYDSQGGTANQMGGIQIGGGSICDCFNNRISHGKGSGIEVFGRGNFMIFNNIIEYPGRSFNPDTTNSAFPKHGIFVKDVNTDQDAKIQIFHNTIISPKSDGILFTNEYLAGSQIQNNIITNPGSYQVIGEKAFVRNNNVDLEITNNYFSLSNEEVMFTDCLQNDYSLRSNSPAVDKGKDLSSFGINFDYQYNSRPMGKGFDIGAYESDPDDADEEINNILVYPNPFTNKITITFCQSAPGDVTLELFNLTGQKVMVKMVKNVPAGINKLEFDISSLRNGIYLIRLSTEVDILTTRALKFG